jgi:hypothetical protein
MTVAQRNPIGAPVQQGNCKLGKRPCCICEQRRKKAGAGKLAPAFAV